MSKKNWYCMECHEHFGNMNKHLNEIKHRCKLYSSQYDNMCKYKNCKEFGSSEGYYNPHLVVSGMVI